MLFDNWDDIVAEIQELDDMSRELRRDANLSKELLIPEETRNERIYSVARQYTRGAFSCIEAVIYRTKRLSTTIAWYDEKLSLEGRTALDEDYFIDKKGEIDKHHLKSKDNVKWVFSFSQVTGSDYMLIFLLNGTTS